MRVMLCFWQKRANKVQAAIKLLVKPPPFFTCACLNVEAGVQGGSRKLPPNL